MMKDTALYEQLLGLQSPWSMNTVDRSLAEQRIVVEGVLTRGQVWADPTDATTRAHINGWTERQWRHLDPCQCETLITARVPQRTYRDGTVEELAVPWAERYSRVTTLMASCVITLLQACPTTQSVCGRTRRAWSPVNDSMVRAVARGMRRRAEDEVPHRGLDEKRAERGHSYVSILTDIDRSRVLDLVPERTLKAATTRLETRSPTQRASVNAVAMDRWPACMSATHACIPPADIVHDRCHVSTYRGEAVNTVRKHEHRRVTKAGVSPLTGSTCAWLTRDPDGRRAEAVAVRALHQRNLTTSRAWRITDTFVQFWADHDTGAATRVFDAWANTAMRSRLEPVKKVVLMLRRHATGVLNDSQHRISTACAEGFKSAIQLMKANARGFRNFTNDRARILFQCGTLDLSLG